MPDRERKRFPEHRSDILKGSLPQGSPAHPRNTEYLSIRGRAKRAQSRVAMKQLREVWRSCTRDSVIILSNAASSVDSPVGCLKCVAKWDQANPCTHRPKYGAGLNVCLTCLKKKRKKRKKEEKRFRRLIDVWFAVK